jgi:tricorn protease-like protein
VTTTPAAVGSTTITQALGVVKPVAWLADGRLTWIGAGRTGGPESTIWVMAAGHKPESVVHDVASFIFEARVSPDARWIAYSTNRSGRFEVEVSSFPRAGRRYPVSTDGGAFPRWRADSRELYFLSPDSRLMAVSFAGGAEPAIGEPAPQFEVRLVAHPDRGTFAD